MPCAAYLFPYTLTHLIPSAPILSSSHNHGLFASSASPSVVLFNSLLCFKTSWGWFDNIAHNKYKRWVRRFPKQSVNEDSSIIEDSDVSSPADDEDDDEGEGNFVFVPRNQSMLNPLGDPNDSVTDNISMEASSPFSSDVAVRRRTIDRLDSVVSVGSRSVC